MWVEQYRRFAADRANIVLVPGAGALEIGELSVVCGWRRGEAPILKSRLAMRSMVSEGLESDSWMLRAKSFRMTIA